MLLDGSPPQGRGSSCGLLLNAKLRIPSSEYILQFVVQYHGSGLQQQVCALQRPLHRLFLDEAPAHHRMDRRLHERGADRLALTVTLPEVRDEFPVVAN